MAFILLFWLAFFVITLLRIEKGIKIAIWGTLASSIIIFFVFGYFCYREYRKILGMRCLYGENRYNCGGTSARIYLYIAFAFWVVGLIYMIWMGWLFNRINLAIGLFKAALKFTKRLKDIRWLPLYSVGFMGILMIVFLWIIIQSSSVVNKTFIDASKYPQNLILIDIEIDGNQVVYYQPDYTLTYFVPGDFIIIMFFTVFTVSWSEFMSAYAFSIWFFSRKNETIDVSFVNDER